MTNIPTEETISPAWLTKQLNASGFKGTVTDFTSKRIGTGQIGKCVRYQLNMTGGDEKTPTSIIAKFPSDDPSSRSTGVMLKNFKKEVSFYQELKSRLTINAADCYFAAIEGDGPDFALLLEDLSPAEQGDQLNGTNPEIARAALLQLVGLHAPTWNDESLRGLDWLGEPSPEGAALTGGLYAGNVDGFVERYKDKLKDDEIALIRKIGGNQGARGETLPSPFSLVHVDYRLDNLLIDETQTPPKITAVDWQTITLGSPLADVAYFIGAGLRADARRPVEEELVRTYYHALCEAGIQNYGWDACWDDYRRGTFAGIFMAVIASMLVVRTERGDEMFLTMARRHTRHAIDLKAEEFLD
ncbi:MAG: phosphotransferase [Parvibaculum sp.]